MRRTGDTPQPGLEWRDPERGWFLSIRARRRAVHEHGTRLPEARAPSAQTSGRDQGVDEVGHHQRGRATVVRFKQDGFEREAHARCEVILTAGSIASPQISERSGIGDGERLKELGVEVGHALPGVGENLQDHYVARFCCHAKDVETFNERARGIRLGWEILCYTFTRKGPLTTAPGNVSASIKVMPGVATPDVQLAFAPASYVEGQLGVLDDFTSMTCGVWQHRPASRGSIHLASTDPEVQPSICLNYLTDVIDQDTMIGGLRKARKLFATCPRELRGY